MEKVIKRLMAIVILSGLSLAGAAAYAVEFEVLDKFSADDYSELRGSAAVSSGLLTVGRSTFVVKSGNVGIGITNPLAVLDVSRVRRRRCWPYNRG